MRSARSGGYGSHWSSESVPLAAVGATFASLENDAASVVTVANVSTGSVVSAKVVGSENEF